MLPSRHLPRRNPWVTISEQYVTRYPALMPHQVSKTPIWLGAQGGSYSFLASSEWDQTEAGRWWSLPIEVFVSMYGHCSGACTNLLHITFFRAGSPSLPPPLPSLALPLYLPLHDCVWLSLSTFLAACLCLTLPL